MRVRTALPLLMLLTLATASLMGDDKKPSDNQAAFEKFKQLAGEWVGKGHIQEGPPVRILYKVTAGGSAVVETLFPGTDHEMVSVIHPDGPDLILTHYCHLGNQPQMKATGLKNGSTVEFKFVRATNLKSEKSQHMHQATFTFVDADTLKSEWTLYDNGQAAHQVAFELKRKK